jgi:hypothetical protein
MGKNYGVTVNDPTYMDTLERVETRFKVSLGVTESYTYQLGSEEVTQMKELYPEIAKAADALLGQLEIVSDYGRTNEKEDFAETFVAFLAAPASLTPTAKFRMQRALSLSGFYNKPVMRLARKVAERFLSKK